MKLTSSFQSPVSIEEQEASHSISVFPNPTEGEIHLAASSEIERIAIKDGTGRQLLDQAAVNANSFSVDMSEYPIGVYFLRITTLSETRSYKVVKR